MRLVRLITAALGVGRRAERFRGSPRSGFAPIVVGGCGRSGTTRFRSAVRAIYEAAEPRPECIEKFAALCLTLRYEDLVRDPGSVLRGLMAFLGEPWDDAMLTRAGGSSTSRDVMRFAQNPEPIGAINASSIGRWQRDLDARERRVLKRTAGPLLIELGYARDNDW